MFWDVPVKRAYPPLLWRSTCGNYKVAIDQKAYCHMCKLAAEHYPNEVGTSLLGEYSADGFEARVLSLAPLTSDSKGGPTWFVRGVSGLNEFYQRVFKRFGGRRHYVGEWHSHPDSRPHRSGTDLHSHAGIAHNECAACPEVVMIILGGQPATRPELEVSVYSRRRGEVRLTPVQAGSRC